MVSGKLGAELTQESVLATVAVDLLKRSSGFRASFNFQRLAQTDDAEWLRRAYLHIFLLEDAAKVVAFRTETRVKLLSDPSPEQHVVSEWQLGSLEDVAKTVCTLLEV